MVYEAEIAIRRDNPRALMADFEAVTALLERRRTARRAEDDKPSARRGQAHLTSMPR